MRYTSTNRWLFLLYFSTFGLNKAAESNQKPFVMIMERAGIKCNSNYVTNCSATIHKYNRTSPYSLTIYAYDLCAWGRNLSVLFKSYEWKDNQFKESFITFNLNACDVLEKERLILPSFRKYSNFPKHCPFPKGEIFIRDLIPDISGYPDAFPISKWLFSFTTFMTKTNKVIANVNLTLRTERIVRTKKRKNTMNTKMKSLYSLK